jgi:hypothetical protein
VLQSNGYLWEYHDAGVLSSPSWSYVYSGSIQAIDTGTDKYGVNAVDVLFSWGDAWMHSDTDGWHFLMSGVQQVSGGQQGLVALLDHYGNAYWYSEWSGSPTWLTSGVLQVTTGYDAWGHLTVGVVLNGGSAWLFWPNSPTWSFLAGEVWQMSKDNLGVITVLFGGTNAFYFDLNGQHSLTGGGTVAVA